MAASGNTIFVTYVLVPTGQTAGDGYEQGVHCNYIKKIESTQVNPYITEVNISFNDVNDFKFMSDGNGLHTGYTVNRIHAIVQIVDNTHFDTFDDVKPNPATWKYMDITDQIVGYSGVLTPELMMNQVFKVSLYNYDSLPIYNLDYLNYPSISQQDSLSFGASTYFFGNVSTHIKADVYTTDISINLSLGEFNSSTNKTWDGSETVYISEVGIYDSNMNLVAIGKLNDPVAKDSNIARTLVFELDF